MEKKNSGLGDLDRLIDQLDQMEERVMVIDSSVFNSTILQLFISSEEHSKKERYDELRNIWINYYRDSFSEGGNNVTNVLSTPFRIVDVDGKTIVDTPPLIIDRVVPDVNYLSASYVTELRHSGPGVKNRYTKSMISNIQNVRGQEWSNFITDYMKLMNMTETEYSAFEGVDEWLQEE